MDTSTLELLSRKKFKKFIESELGYYFVIGNNKLFEKIQNDDYHSSDDIYTLDAHNITDVQIYLIRREASKLKHTVKLIKKQGTIEEQTELQEQLDFINNKDMPYVTRMLVVEMIFDSPFFQKIEQDYYDNIDLEKLEGLSSDMRLPIIINFKKSV